MQILKPLVKSLMFEELVITSLQVAFTSSLGSDLAIKVATASSLDSTSYFVASYSIASLGPASASLASAFAFLVLLVASLELQLAWQFIPSCQPSAYSFASAAVTIIDLAVAFTSFFSLI